MGYEKDSQTKIFEWFARRSPRIIPLFHFFYYVWVVVYLFGAYLTLTNSPLAPQVYQFGKHLGRAAITLLGVVVMPGILGRFKIEIKLTRLITLFRRQLGIVVFMFAFTHYSFVRLLPTVTGFFGFKIPYPTLFENLGALALFILFLMFVTSNNLSVKKMGKWWKRLHRFVYVAIWFLVLHTALQRISIWSAGILIVAVLEVVSLMYDYFRKKGLHNITTGSTSRSDGSAG